DQTTTEPTFTPYVADTAVVPTNPPVNADTSSTPSEAGGDSTPGVHVNVARRHSISPWIYGVADSTPGDEDLLRWLGVTLVRWGGNARSRHNWEINASNAGSDYEFRNVSQGDNKPGSASLMFMQRNERLG